MEVRYLLYIGNKKEGSLIVKIIKSPSPFRLIKYWKGMRLRIGVDVSTKVAEFLVSDYKSLFKIESELLSDSEEFKDSFLRLVLAMKKKCKDKLFLKKMIVLTTEVFKQIEEEQIAEKGSGTKRKLRR